MTTQEEVSKFETVPSQVSSSSDRGVGLRGFESHPPHREHYQVQNGRVLGHAFFLKKEGYRESTITSRVKALRSLSRKADLLD